ncbi:hypothetical protein [Isosphaera pallida]|uniref:hypothetical protein n=1 Tax=Isosphaera pallida TaxID=128 RepID=UPI00031C0246|nr:hypothetical protein [Isosphaera pallida]
MVGNTSEFPGDSLDLTRRQPRRWPTLVKPLAVGAVLIATLAAVVWWWNRPVAADFEIRLWPPDAPSIGSTEALRVWIVKAHAESNLESGSTSHSSSPRWQGVPGVEVTAELVDRGTRRKRLATWTTDATGTAAPSVTWPDWSEGSYKLVLSARRQRARETLEVAVRLQRAERMAALIDRHRIEAGEPLNILAWMTSAPGHTPLVNRRVEAQLLNTERTVVSLSEARTNAHGIAELQFITARSLPPGEYVVKLRSSGGVNEWGLRIDPPLDPLTPRLALGLRPPDPSNPALRGWLLARDGRGAPRGGLSVVLEGRWINLGSATASPSPAAPIRVVTNSLGLADWSFDPPLDSGALELVARVEFSEPFTAPSASLVVPLPHPTPVTLTPSQTADAVSPASSTNDPDTLPTLRADRPCVAAGSSVTIQVHDQPGPIPGTLDLLANGNMVTGLTLDLTNGTGIGRLTIPEMIRGVVDVRYLRPQADGTVVTRWLCLGVEGPSQARLRPFWSDAEPPWPSSTDTLLKQHESVPALSARPKRADDGPLDGLVLGVIQPLTVTPNRLDDSLDLLDARLEEWGVVFDQHAADTLAHRASLLNQTSRTLGTWMSSRAVTALQGDGSSAASLRNVPQLTALAPEDRDSASRRPSSDGEGHSNVTSERVEVDQSAARPPELPNRSRPAGINNRGEFFKSAPPRWLRWIRLNSPTDATHTAPSPDLSVWFDAPRAWGDAPERIVPPQGWRIETFLAHSDGTIAWEQAQTTPRLLRAELYLPSHWTLGDQSDAVAWVWNDGSHDHVAQITWRVQGGLVFSTPSSHQDKETDPPGFSETQTTQTIVVPAGGVVGLSLALQARVAGEAVLKLWVESTSTSSSTPLHTVSTTQSPTAWRERSAIIDPPGRIRWLTVGGLIGPNAPRTLELALPASARLDDPVTTHLRVDLVGHPSRWDALADAAETAWRQAAPTVDQLVFGAWPILMLAHPVSFTLPDFAAEHRVFWDHLLDATLQNLRQRADSSGNLSPWGNEPADPLATALVHALIARRQSRLAADLDLQRESRRRLEALIIELTPVRRFVPVPEPFSRSGGLAIEAGPRFVPPELVGPESGFPRLPQRTSRVDQPGVPPSEEPSSSTPITKEILPEPGSRNNAPDPAFRSGGPIMTPSWMYTRQTRDQYLLRAIGLWSGGHSGAMPGAAISLQTDFFRRDLNDAYAQAFILLSLMNNELSPRSREIQSDFHLLGRLRSLGSLPNDPAPPGPFWTTGQTVFGCRGRAAAQATTALSSLTLTAVPFFPNLTKLLDAATEHLWQWRQHQGVWLSAEATAWAVWSLSRQLGSARIRVPTQLLLRAGEAGTPRLWELPLGPLGQPQRLDLTDTVAHARLAVTPPTDPSEPGSATLRWRLEWYGPTSIPTMQQEEADLTQLAAPVLLRARWIEPEVATATPHPRLPVRWLDPIDPSQSLTLNVGMVWSPRLQLDWRSVPQDQRPRVVAVTLPEPPGLSLERVDLELVNDDDHDDATPSTPSTASASQDADASKTDQSQARPGDVALLERRRTNEGSGVTVLIRVPPQPEATRLTARLLPCWKARTPGRAILGAVEVVDWDDPDTIARLPLPTLVAPTASAAQGDKRSILQPEGDNSSRR